MHAIRLKTVTNIQQDYPSLNIELLGRLYGYYYVVITKDKKLKRYKDLKNFRAFLSFGLANGLANDTYPIRKIEELGWIPSNIAFRKEDLFNVLLKAIPVTSKTGYNHVYCRPLNRYVGSIPIKGKRMTFPYTTTPEESYISLKAYILNLTNPSDRDLILLSERELIDMRNRKAKL